ncbi:LuxR C-terminal-related transcriptional regulator [Pseudonocardia sp. N23]|uniref:helix-turn-helix transcriptional regulator n=1 Tax=Pseudonocardia sp. N23 TaxID=1987376 RepID=UPI00209BBDF1|nr:LuxR C-terminal-related transcriptional regulator [Pseudonocardia sp. N23]
MTVQPATGRCLVRTWEGGAAPVLVRVVVDRGVTTTLTAALERGAAACVRWAGTGRALAVPLRLREGRLDAWLLTRDDPGFGPDEVEHAALLAPGLLRLLAGETDTGPALEPVVRAVRTVRPPEQTLTRREGQVLGLVALGLTADAIGRRLGISGRTVHKHLEHAYGKLGCADRLSAVLRARELGLVPADPPAGATG